jgi:hypothetical protein
MTRPLSVLLPACAILLGTVPAQARCCGSSQPLTPAFAGAGSSHRNIFSRETCSDDSWSRPNIFHGQDYHDRNGNLVLTCRRNIFGGQTCDQ